LSLQKVGTGVVVLKDDLSRVVAQNLAFGILQTVQVNPAVADPVK